MSIPDRWKHEVEDACAYLDEKFPDNISEYIDMSNIEGGGTFMGVPIEFFTMPYRRKISAYSYDYDKRQKEQRQKDKETLAKLRKRRRSFLHTFNIIDL